MQSNKIKVLLLLAMNIVVVCCLPRTKRSEMADENRGLSNIKTAALSRIFVDPLELVLTGQKLWDSLDFTGQHHDNDRSDEFRHNNNNRWRYEDERENDDGGRRGGQQGGGRQGSGRRQGGGRKGSGGRKGGRSGGKGWGMGRRGKRDTNAQFYKTLNTQIVEKADNGHKEIGLDAVISVPFSYGFKLLQHYIVDNVYEEAEKNANIESDAEENDEEDSNEESEVKEDENELKWQYNDDLHEEAGTNASDESDAEEKEDDKQFNILCKNVEKYTDAESDELDNMDEFSEEATEESAVEEPEDDIEQTEISKSNEEQLETDKIREEVNDYYRENLLKIMKMLLGQDFAGDLPAEESRERLYINWEPIAAN